MATSISPQPMTVTLTESITLKGYDQGASNSFSIADIAQVYKRQITCTASQTTTIATFAAATHTSDHALVVGDAKYIRVTNLDASVNVQLGLIYAATTAIVSLKAGQSFVLGAPDDIGLAEDDNTAANYGGTMTDITDIEIAVGGAAVDVEIFVAST